MATTTTNRALRKPQNTDTDDPVRDIGYLADDVDSWLASKRLYLSSVTTASLTNGGSVTSLAIPAQTYASRVVIRILGDVGFSAATNQIVGVNIAASAGSLTHQRQNQGIRCAEVGQWYPLARSAYVDLAAATASTLTFTLYVSGGWNAYFSGDVTAEIRQTGEY